MLARDGTPKPKIPVRYGLRVDARRRSGEDIDALRQELVRERSWSAHLERAKGLGHSADDLAKRVAYLTQRNAELEAQIEKLWDAAMARARKANH